MRDGFADLLCYSATPCRPPRLPAVQRKAESQGPLVQLGVPRLQELHQVRTVRRWAGDVRPMRPGLPSNVSGSSYRGDT